MSKVIIAIHGLGNKPSKNQLREWGEMAIQEGLKLQGYNVELPEFKPVYRADLIYDRPQSTDEPDKNSPYFLDEVYTQTPKNYGFENPDHTENTLMPCSIRDHYENFRENILTPDAKGEDEEADAVLLDPEYKKLLEEYDEELQSLTESIFHEKYLKKNTIK